MSDIATSLEQVAAAVVVADASDPAAILRLHDDVRALRDALPPAAAPAIQAASDAESVLQRIILLEEANTRAALERVGALVAAVQTALDSSLASPPVTTASASSPADTPAFRDEDLALVRDFVTESREHLESVEAEVLKLESGSDPEAVNAIFRGFHTIKGVAGFLNLHDIGHLAHSAENLLDQARNGRLTLDPPAIDLVLRSVDAAKTMLGLITASLDTGQPIVPFEGLSALQADLDDCAAGKQTKSAPRTPGVCKPGANAPATTNRAESTVKVSTQRLDNLINMVGELVVTQSMIWQRTQSIANGDPAVARNLTRLGKITRELQDISMSMRMVPIQSVFQKMTRLVRDLAPQLGKQVELTIVGGDTELDRNVVEAIADPLVHMIRNAVDHGVETPDVRRAAGKSPVGRLTLKAYHLAGQVVIEISDDGKGLNRARILKKATDAGIIRPDQSLTDADVHRLIFHAGLSTAEKVTDVSGRGVGMDVVKKNIEALRGYVDITSAEGKGSTFTVRLPLTLAVIDGLVVRVGSQRFILPILAVEQSLRPTSSQLSTVQGRGEICLVRGRPLPVIRLHRVLGVTSPCVEDPTQGLVVIVRDNAREACLLVDSLVGQQQVVIKSLGASLATARGFAGGAILGDGAVSLILDVPGVIQLAGSDPTTKEAA